MPFRAPALSEVEDRIFTERRLLLCGAAALAVSIAVLGWALVSGQSALTPHGLPSTIDFLQFYVMGNFAGSPDPAAAYDYRVFSAAQAALVGSVDTPLPFYHLVYPPILFFVTYPLALLPFGAAFAVWVGATFVLYQSVMFAVVPRTAMLVVAAVPLAVLKNAQLGQNGFLTAGLIGLVLLLMERRPVLAGVALGLLIYKPQFGLLFPLALVAGGHWRVIAGAAATIALLVVIAAAVFGPEIWAAHLASLGGFNARLSPDDNMQVLLQSVFGFCQWLGATPSVSWVAHLTAAGPAAIAVGVLWYRATPFPLQAAALAVAAVAVTPYVLTYDLCVLAVAVAFLVQDGLRRGFLPGERSLLLLCFVLSLFLTRPIAPALYLVLFGIVVWRAACVRSDTVAASPTGAAPREPAMPDGVAPGMARDL
jgi:hypothetical protein